MYTNFNNIITMILNMPILIINKNEEKNEIKEKNKILKEKIKNL